MASEDKIEGKAACQARVAVYARGQSDASVSWREFREAWAGCDVVEAKDDRGSRWIIKHPLQDVRFYGPVAGLLRKTISAAHLADEDVTRILNERAIKEHPFFDALFRLVQLLGMYIVVELPFAKGLIIGSAHNNDTLPSRLVDRCFMFSCATPDELKRVFTSVLEVHGFLMDLQTQRSHWADAQEQDETAHTAFKDFILGKRGSKPKLEWNGQPLRLAHTPGSFDDRYCIAIDWRDVDAEAVKLFADLLKRDKLDVEETEFGLTISCNERRIEISEMDIGKDRYNALRALNTVLAPEYEVRLLKGSNDGDTHSFALAPIWLWKSLENENADKLQKKFKRIAASDSFL